MKLSVLSIICVFPLYTFAQLAQTLTDDGQGNSIYVPTAGSTSAVAAPAATPTLVYNCLQMPLICENVAAYANDNGGTNGDLPNQQVLLYYDPDNTNKDKRRGVACGCFEHDTCNTATANGKSSGSKVTDIATASPRTNTFTSISPGATNIILAGVNPGTSPRVPLNGIPGRFFGQGTAFSCDGKKSTLGVSEI
jgi:hypothetical protein